MTTDPALRALLLDIPPGTSYTDLGDMGGWNRYDTDDTIVLHLWRGGRSWDITLPLAAAEAAPLDVERLARALDVIGARYDPGGVDLTETVAREYAALADAATSREWPKDGIDHDLPSPGYIDTGPTQGGPGSE
jgi:hypothetical protein